MVLTIFNATDGIPVTIKSFRKVETVTKWIDKKRKEFLKIQGYYLTSRRERIHPNDVVYIITNHTTGEKFTY